MSEERTILRGKTAVITGGARGIGGAIAATLAHAGADVVIADILDEAGAALADSLRRDGLGARYVHTDMADAGQVRGLIAAALDRQGSLQILVNNAGVLCDDYLAEDIPPQVWERLVSVNLTGVFLASKYALPVMMENGGGAIVNIASVSALVASKNNIPYCATKAAVLGLTRSIAYDYARYNIRANAICPGCCETSMITDYLDSLSEPLRKETYDRFIRQQPLGRLGTAEDIAAAALFLASEDSSFITGASLAADGGYTAI